MTRYEPQGGINISVACREACRLASERNDSVEFEFNGTRVVAHNGEAPTSIERIWWLSREVERLRRLADE